MKVRLVKDMEKIMAVELENEWGHVYFISVRDPDFWTGVRVGSFPSRSDGTAFEREDFIGNQNP